MQHRQLLLKPLNFQTALRNARHAVCSTTHANFARSKITGFQRRRNGPVERQCRSQGVEVHLYVDASYGVHADRRSHTGSCVVIGDVGAVHCKSSKQQIVTKSSTEAELVGLSDSANQALFIRNFLTLQGYRMAPVVIFQDNMSCMALLARGRSGGERTRHIAIRYFWVKDRVNRKEARIVHKGTAEMYANLLTKPLQGGQFQYERMCLTGWPMVDRVVSFGPDEKRAGPLVKKQKKT
jgi:hypothetical protein